MMPDDRSDVRLGQDLRRDTRNSVSFCGRSVAEVGKRRRRSVCVIVRDAFPRCSQRLETTSSPVNKEC